MKKDKLNDLIIVTLITIIITLSSLLFQGNFLITTVLFFGAPALYLAIKNKKAIKKSFLFSLIVSIPITFIFDYLVSKDKGWHIVSTVFPFRIFDIIAIEQFAWTLLWAFYIIMFYEYFFDKKERRSLLSFFSKKSKIITKRMEQFSKFFFAITIIFLSIALINPNLLKIDHAYLVLGTILVIIPLITFLLHFPNFFMRFLKVTLYFMFLSILIEYIGLKLNHWIFPGKSILGEINFFGFMIPYEEIILYVILSTPAALSYYEYLDDDQR